MFRKTVQKSAIMFVITANSFVGNRFLAIAVVLSCVLGKF